MSATENKKGLSLIQKMLLVGVAGLVLSIVMMLVDKYFN